MQLAAVEFARHKLGLQQTGSDTPHPILCPFRPHKDRAASAALRLGQYTCQLVPGTKAQAAYAKPTAQERYRHLLKLDCRYRKPLEEAGLKVAGTSADGRQIEIIELEDHPWFIGTQFHPELKSRPNRPHPLFNGFIAASAE